MPIADKYNAMLAQMQAYEAQKQPQGLTQGVMPFSPPPSRESVLKRIAETEALLKLLREVDSLLAAHPDLERLIGTLRKLGSL